MTEWVDMLGEALSLPRSENFLRLGCAILCGGLIGLERELRDKPAGLRTIVLICVGSCLFAIISQRVSANHDDSTRIAAQIVTGVGFLGAGAIIRGDGGIVLGLTTAATIWTVAAVGMAAGFGEFMLAAEGTAAVMVTLVALQLVDRSVSRAHEVQTHQFSLPAEGEPLADARKLFAGARLKIVSNTFYQEGDRVRFEITAHGAHSAHESLREKMLGAQDYQLERGGQPLP
jgi:putative Mg2+ transporter-C (MgtC) family protein